MALLTVGEAIIKSGAYLRAKGVTDSPRLDAELLLCDVLGTDRIHLYMDWQKPLLDLEVAAYRELLRRRGQEREPVARIRGWKEFHGRRFDISPAAFVPRPETEGLVERAIDLLRTKSIYQSQPATVLEVGTGTGCITVTLAAEEGQHRYLATDISAEALHTARHNAERNGVEQRIELRHGELFAGWKGPLGMIVSNPPYIESAVVEELAPEVRVHDPRAALDGGADGLDVVRRIAKEGATLLVEGGWVVLEVGDRQGAACRTIFGQDRLYEEIRVEKDLSGFDRYVAARRTAR